jgi:putative ATP-dependent endonuclease of OLD family
VYLSEILASGFRCFASDAPLRLKLRSGLNVLAGPNDAGKTAIIDAPRFVLWTRGDDYVRLEATDFHVGPTGKPEREMLIRCTFDHLSAAEEKRFLEWCDNEDGTLRLYVNLRATLRTLDGGGDKILTHYRTGKNMDGLPIEGDLREYLKATYLRPLRDAERELTPGRRSRLSRILGALPEMGNQKNEAPAGQPKTLFDIVKAADRAVEQNRAVEGVSKMVNETYLDHLSFADDSLKSTLGLGSKGAFDQLLERLELYLDPPNNSPGRVPRGLGYNNLLFMAAELLLLQCGPDQLRFLLIEEPEAHLHPQHQTLFMGLLEDRAAPDGKEGGEEDRQQVQILLSTHSPHLAASVDLDSMILTVRQKTYPLLREQTKLEEDDYAFLRRFLDATKANLFFARGVMIVEGDAENILLPAIAEKIGLPFGKHGVSIVNVGHRGLFRYSRIFQRKDNAHVPVPVALIPDRDVPPADAKDLVGDRETEAEWEPARKQHHEAALREDAGGCVEAFPSDQWTLEFDLARNPKFASLMHQAVQLAKRKKEMSKDAVLKASRAEVEAWQSDGSKTADHIAAQIYEPLHKGRVSKAVVAEQLAKLVYELEDDQLTFKSRLPGYLVQAIEYVTQARAKATKDPGRVVDPKRIK